MNGSRTLRELLDELDRWRVRAARGTGKARVPLRDLAAASGVPHSSLAKYLAGATVMPADVLDAVVQALGADAKQAREWAVAWEEATADHLRSDRREPAPVRGLWQLPADTGLFTGRDGEVKTILNLAAQALASSGPGAVLISAIDGMGGIGKTTLAVHAGHLLADRFPDGALFLELHTHTVAVAARTAFDVQGITLVALGAAPQAIPADPDARAAAYRHRLAGTRTLIVVDDARDENQVRTLLPGTAGCLVLVTSRNRLKALDDAEALRLDVLTQDEAIELFCKTAGSERTNTADPAVLQIIQLCGSLPLAVRIAGALLRARPAWTPQHLLTDLTENLAGLEAFDDGQRHLATVLDMSYRHLPAPARVLLRRLGQIPGPDADIYAAAALLDCDPKTADRLLGLLADRSILTEHTVGRWRMHDLLREHAHALANTEDTPEQRQDALDRLLHYYAHTAQTASAPIARTPRPTPDSPAPAHTPDLSDPETARVWLRTEYPNLDAAFTYAHASRLRRHTAALAAGMAEVLHADGPLTRALEVHQAAEAVTRNSPPATRANILNDLGRVRRMTGDLPDAADAQTQALQIYRQIGNRLGEAYALTELGLVRHRTGDFPGAADAQTQALQIYRQIGNRFGEANALTELGQVRRLTGDFPGAEDAATQALQIYRQIGNRLGEAYALADLGLVRQQAGDLPGAADAQTQALQIFRQIGNRHGEAYALTELGQVRQQAGDLPGAADTQAQALQIFRQIGNRLGEANALTALDRMRHRTGDLPGAADAQTQALQIYRQIGSRVNEAWALNFYAGTIAALGDRPQALALYQQALDMNRGLNKPDDEAISLEGIADHHLNTGNPEQGIAYLNQALEIFQRLGMRLDIERAQARLAVTSGQ
ncbi:MAG: tetratricopeptide repeat protein [Catenulispora sp.]|nr:tetratricopeptide repeat protein [Catenulispora sp.]